MTTEFAEQTYDLDLLSGSQDAWDRSEGLRFVYGEIYRGIRARCSTDGAMLEIGSGIGVSKAFFDNLVTSDVVKTPYVDRAISAYEIEPDVGGAWANIFAIDVLHHLKQPMRFFESAAAVLKPGGRIILVEPAATLGGRVFYSLCHHEPIQPQLIVPSFEFEANGPDGEFANMGMGVGVFMRNRELAEALLAEWGLRCKEVSFQDVFAYPLTGGYSKPQLLPTIALQGLLKLEQYLPQWFYRLFGLRMVVVLEKI